MLSLSVTLFVSRVGFDRDRAFYPTVLIVIAWYYVLFAAMSGSVRTVLLESIVMAAFSTAAAVGFKSSAWIVVVGWPATASLMPFTATSWKTQGFHVGGQPLVSLLTSEQRAVSLGS